MTFTGILTNSEKIPLRLFYSLLIGLWTDHVMRRHSPSSAKPIGWGPMDGKWKSQTTSYTQVDSTVPKIEPSLSLHLHIGDPHRPGFKRYIQIKGSSIFFTDRAISRRSFSSIDIYKIVDSRICPNFPFGQYNISYASWRNSFANASFHMRIDDAA